MAPTTDAGSVADLEPAARERLAGDIWDFIAGGSGDETTLAANRAAPARYPGCHRAVDTAHVLMAVGMAAMASPVGGPLPVAGWQAIFLLMTGWFVGSWWLERGVVAPPGGWHGGGLHHAAAGAAMLYMLSAGSHSMEHLSAPWMPGHVPGLAWPVVR